MPTPSILSLTVRLLVTAVHSEASFAAFAHKDSSGKWISFAQDDLIIQRRSIVDYILAYDLHLQN